MVSEEEGRRVVLLTELVSEVGRERTIEGDLSYQSAGERKKKVMVDVQELQAYVCGIDT